VAAPKKYPDELRARAVRLWRESDPKPVIERLAEQLGVHPEALRNWIRQDEADRSERDDRPTSDMLEENRRLRKEVAELRRANEASHAVRDRRSGPAAPTARGGSSRSATPR
jgi:transposase-like protein